MTTLFYSSFIGIEIRDDTIVVSCLKNDFSGINLLSSGVFPLKDDDETIADISKFISQYISHAVNVFVSIPYKWSIVKFVEIPSPKGKGKDALMHMMRFEIERHIPYQVDEVFYDFQMLGKREAAYKAVFAAVHKEKIDYVKGFLEKLSLKPQIITLSPFSVLNAIGFSEISVGGWQGLLGITKKPDICGHKNEACIMLFVDKNNACFAVQRNGIYSYLKSFSISTNNPLDEIVDNISSELGALQTEVSGEKINKVILSGEDVSLAEISIAIEEKFGLRVQTVDPLKKFLKDKKSTGIYEILASVGGCYAGFGIGALRINLLPHKADIAIRKTGPKIAKAAAFLIVLLIISIFAGELVNDKRLLKTVEAKIKENEPEIKAVEKISADMNFIEQKRNFLRGKREKDILLDMLAELTNIMPVESWLTDFDYKEVFDEKSGSSKRELIITGQASSSSALISILENSPFFEKVEFVGSVTAIGNKEGFKIKAVIVIPEKSSDAPDAQKEKTDLKGTKGSK
ncbi:MAG: pilus assembly protein PilM [Thermodesulfovibrionia bacterium]|nr:pilus assembly protein PilM [Thermodesulfovibrionia bacterium]